MMVKDLHKAFHMEYGNITIYENGKYNETYVKWLEKKILELTTF
jgi:hypothetical protein